MRCSLLLLLFFTPFISQAQTPCHPDFDALMALYNATDGPNWTNNTGWVDGAAGTDCDVCNWYGVDCYTNGRVSELTLASNKLNGLIPSEIGDLTTLNILNLGGNQLSGTIPTEIGNLINLFSLLLGTNQLSGSIPAEIGNLTAIHWISLGGNQLSGSIPSELGDLIHLFLLYLNDNQLSGVIPTEIENLQSLFVLDLSNNQLDGSIPPGIGTFSNIIWLTLSNNQLSGTIPLSLGNLTHADTIHLDNNQLTGCFPTHLSSLCGTVGNVDFSNNTGLPGGGNFDMFCATGAGDCNLPPSNCHPDFNALITFYNTTNGENWTGNAGWVDGAAGTDCDVCNWYGITCDGNGRVISIFLQYNNLAGGISSNIEELTFLENLGLRDNNLLGYLPTAIGNLSNLKSLDFVDNQLSGTIPSEIGNLTNLEELFLSNNKFTGSIPPELGDLSNLIYLHLSGNYLTGELPPELGNLSSIEDVFISSTAISGNLPAEWGNLPSGVFLWLKNNLLTGCIPSSFSNLCSSAIILLEGNNMVNDGNFGDFCADGTGGCDAALELKVLLKGPYDTDLGLMKDDLRTASLIPNTLGISYSQFQTLTSTIGNDAIVDWVEVEFRPVGNESTIQVKRDLFVQRDGDIVDKEGNPFLYFWDLPAGDYHVAVRHRNHLGVMSMTTVTVN